MRIAVDAMGGDFAPVEIVMGARAYIRENKDDVIILVGDQVQIENILRKNRGSNDRIEIVHTIDWFKMAEKVDNIRSRSTASVVLAARKVREGKADAMVALGNSGAAVASAALYIGRQKGVGKPPIASIVPRLGGGGSVFLDIGAVSDCDEHLLAQFANLGAIYARQMLGIEIPIVKTLSIGEEDEKGNKVVQKTGELLRASQATNTHYRYEGNIESRSLFFGHADVIVADGFSGNIALKAVEGLLDFIKELIKEDKNCWLPALMALWLYKKLKKKISAEEYGGAPLLGLEGVCIIGHGNSKRKAVVHAIEMAKKTVLSGIVEATRQQLEREQAA